MHRGFDKKAFDGSLKLKKNETVEKSKSVETAKHIKMKKFIKTEFNYSYADLSLLYNTKLQFVERDAAILAKYGIKKFEISKLRELSNRFRNALLDPELVVNQKEATYLKEEVVEILTLKLKYLRIALENSQSKRELKVQLPEIFNLSDQNAQNIVKTADLVYRYCTQKQAILEDWGVSKQFLATFYSLVDESLSKLNIIGQTKSDRIDSTIIRHEISNEVYQTLTQFCKVLRSIWIMEKSIAKYNDYVLPSAYRKRKSKNANLTAIQS